MGIGQLRHRVIIKAASSTADGIGGQTTTLSTVATVWGHVRQLDGVRNAEGRTTENKTRYEVVIRSDAYAVTVDNILEFDSVEMKIDSLLQDELKRFTTIEAWA